MLQQLFFHSARNASPQYLCSCYSFVVMMKLKLVTAGRDNLTQSAAHACRVMVAEPGITQHQRLSTTALYT